MGNVKTPEFRVSYPNVFKSRKNQLSGKDEFSVVALFKKGENLDVLKRAVNAAIEEEWGKDKAKWPKGLKTPFRNQGDRAKENEQGKLVLPAGYEEGAIYCNLKSYVRPGIVGPDAFPITDETKFYAGCYAWATVVAKAYNMQVNKGVSFWLQNLQMRRDGEAFGNRSKAEDDFAPIEGLSDMTDGMGNFD